MIREAVARYATRCHRMLGGEHGVVSPFGAWLLLALVAPAADAELRRSIEDALGCDASAAFGAAVEMLRTPHAELVLGSAVWHRSDVETDRLRAYLRRICPPADAGPIPSQAEADAWARERTLGLIDRFPVDVEDGDPLVLLLATAIAARVSWAVPFVLAPPAQCALATDPAFDGVVLLRAPGAGEWHGLLDSEIGVVAAFAAHSQNGLLVTSVVADPGADPTTVLDIAQQIAMGVASGRAPATRSLFDLPLGDGPAWRITEQTRHHSGGDEVYEVLLPAWEARSEHRLLERRELGFADAGQAFFALLPPDDYFAEARQSAMARYTREGFEAAAVTALGVRVASMPMGREGVVRTARIEFTRPHAVVAATAGSGEWDGLPVFSAWVAQAVPAE